MKPKSKLFFVLILLIGIISGIVSTNNIEAAGPTSGKAYAVITEYGELVFVRSTKNYAFNTVGTLEDITGYKWKGRIFNNFESWGFGDDLETRAPWANYAEDIVSLYVANGQQIKTLDMTNWFADLVGLKNAEMAGFDSSQCKSFENLFKNCSSLEYVYLDNSEALNSAVSVRDMFKNCRKLQYINMANQHPVNIEDMSGMFDGCYDLATVEFGDNWKTAKVQTMERMFKDCQNLFELNLSLFTSENLLNATEMFSGCLSLVKLNMKNMSCEKTTEFSEMFYDCRNLHNLDISSMHTLNAENMQGMFENCESLYALDLSKFNTEHVYLLGQMFKGCTYLKTLDLSSFTFTEGNFPDMFQMFDNCLSLISVTLGEGWKVWQDYSYLTNGKWTNGSYTFTQKELYEAYPDGENYAANKDKAKKYAGTWVRYAEDHQTIRLFGEDRYETNLQIADEIKENYLFSDKFSNIVLASGENYPDALGGSFLAYMKDAPLLLIKNKKTVKNNVQNYIRNNLAADGTIYILGGQSAVADAWLGDLGKTYKIKRLEGEDRYDTNLAILRELEDGDYEPNTLMICTGRDYADSLSASGISNPIMLVGNNLTKNQKAYLASKSDPWYFIVVGGEAAVSEKICQQLSIYGYADRISGSNRYETSANLAGTLMLYSNQGKAIIAYGKNYPDGLSAGPLALYAGIPLLLVTSSNSSTKYATAYLKKIGIVGGYVVGGPALISDTFTRRVLNVPSWMEIVTKK